jgi:hypothetical protein
MEFTLISETAATLIPPISDVPAPAAWSVGREPDLCERHIHAIEQQLVVLAAKLS